MLKEMSLLNIGNRLLFNRPLLISNYSFDCVGLLHCSMIDFCTDDTVAVLLFTPKGGMYRIGGRLKN